LDRCAGPGIPAEARFPWPCAEAAEASNLNLLTLAQGARHAVQDPVEDPRDLLAGNLHDQANLFNEILLCHRGTLSDQRATFPAAEFEEDFGPRRDGLPVGRCGPPKLPKLLASPAAERVRRQRDRGSDETNDRSRRDVKNGLPFPASAEPNKALSPTGAPELDKRQRSPK
jgi:hypothetical protein